MTFDLDVLRSFASGMRLGSFAKAADRLGRSTSALSAQMKKLEAQAGLPLFRKVGRGLALTAAGETMLGYANRLIELNDEASAAMRGADVAGWIRVGLAEEFGESLLPQVLGSFARTHPRVRIEASMMRSTDLCEHLSQGKLDLALVWETGTPALLPNGEICLHAPLQWIASSHLDIGALPWWSGPAADHGRPLEPLPLIMVDEPCPVRQIVTTALDQAGIPWRPAFSSTSLAALWAATAAGLGLMVRTPLGQPAGVHAIDHHAIGLPSLPAISLTLYRAQPKPAPVVDQLAALLREALPATAEKRSARRKSMTPG